MPEPEPMPDRIPARERFAVGDRVRATAAAHGSLFRHGSPRTGVVVGFGVDDYCVRVRLDGRKSAATYHADFWEKEPPPASGGPPVPDTEPMPDRIARLRSRVARRLASGRGQEFPQTGEVVDLDVLAALFAEPDALRAELDAMRALVEKGSNELRDAVIERNDARAELARHKPLTLLDPDAEDANG